MKQLLVYYWQASFVLKDKIFEYFAWWAEMQEDEENTPTEK